MNDGVSDYWVMPENIREKVFSEQRFSYRSYNDAFSLIRRNLHRISQKFDCVVGVPRSGLLFANYLALMLNIPLFSLSDVASIDLHRLKTSRSSIPPSKMLPIKVLVVDDSINSGGAFKNAKAIIESNTNSSDVTVTYMALYGVKSAEGIIDIILERVDLPRIFEWNLLHHSYTANFLFDLDGVLSLDGPPEHTNTSTEYRASISKLPPRILPKMPIGAVVTSRLEKNRDVTEDWLNRHNIKYKYLIMLNIETPELRRKLALHGSYKADVYNKLGGCLFVESEQWQALEIFKLTGKPVFCTGTSELLKA